MALPAIWVSSIIYACEIILLCIGFTLTYMTAKIPNFAHSTYAGFGIYTTFTITKVLGYSPYYAFPIAFLVGGIVSTIIYKVVIQVLTRMGGGGIELTITTLAISIILTATLNCYTYWLRDVFKKYTVGFILKNQDFEFLGMPGIFTVSLVLCISTVIILHYMLTNTKIGIAMRATADDVQLASVMGINTNRVQLYSWFLTGGLASLAGAMFPLWFMSGPGSAGGLTTSIMAASLLGGLNSMYGAIIGGFGIAFSEIIGTFLMQKYIGVWVGEYRPLIPMIILIAILLFEPGGLHAIYEKIKTRRKKGGSIDARHSV